MPDGFGIVGSVTSPMLERVLREETLGKEGEQQSRRKKAAKTPPHDDEITEDAVEEDSNASNHINLRI